MMKHGVYLQVLLSLAGAVGSLKRSLVSYLILAVPLQGPATHKRYL